MIILEVIRTSHRARLQKIINKYTNMKSTIDGIGHSISTARDESLELRILRYLHDHTPEYRGQQVLIWVDDEELFKDFTEFDPVKSDLTHVLMAMNTVCSRVNDMWTEQTQDHYIFHEVDRVPLPDPRDIKLEVVREGEWDGTQFVTKGFVFQILTRKWVGLLPLDNGIGYQCNTLAYIPT